MLEYLLHLKISCLSLLLVKIYLADILAYYMLFSNKNNAVKKCLLDLVNMFIVLSVNQNHIHYDHNNYQKIEQAWK